MGCGDVQHVVLDPRLDPLEILDVRVEVVVLHKLLDQTDIRIIPDAQK